MTLAAVGVSLGGLFVLAVPVDGATFAQATDVDWMHSRARSRPSPSTSVVWGDCSDFRTSPSASSLLGLRGRRRGQAVAGSAGSGSSRRT